MHLIGEDDKSYTANIEGKIVKLFKIDTEPINSRHNESVYQASKCLRNDTVYEVFNYISMILNNIPTIDKYEEIAKQVTTYLKEVEIILLDNECINFVFYYIKDIDPSIYGRAQTFIKNITMVKEDFKNIINFQNEKKRGILT